MFDGSKPAAFKSERIVNPDRIVRSGDPDRSVGRLREAKAEVKIKIKIKINGKIDKSLNHQIIK